MQNESSIAEKKMFKFRVDVSFYLTNKFCLKKKIIINKVHVG